MAEVVLMEWGWSFMELDGGCCDNLRVASDRDAPLATGCLADARVCAFGQEKLTAGPWTG